MVRRLITLTLFVLLLSVTTAFANTSDTDSPRFARIPKISVVLVDRTQQWDQNFWLDEISDLLIDRYSYLMSPADIEIIKENRGTDLSKEGLAALAQKKNTDQIVVVVVERADSQWLPSWHIGSRTNFDNDDSYVTTVFIRGAMYQPSTGKYAVTRYWENTTDDLNTTRVLKENTFKLIEKLEKTVPPLI
jgi:hypothetical protein